MEDNSKESENNSNPNTETPLKNNLVSEILKQILAGIDINEAVESVNKVNIEKIKSQELTTLENIKSQNLANYLNSKFFNNKFIKEVFVLVIILFAVCFLAYIGKADSKIIGTLLGSIIGYSIGNFNNNKGN